MVLSTSETAAKIYKTNELEERFILKEKYDDGSPFTRVKNVYNITNIPYIKTPKNGADIIFSKKWSVLIVDEAHKYTKISTSRCQSISCISSDNRMLLSGTLFDEPEIERIFGYYTMLHWPNFPRDIPTVSIHLKSMNFKGTNETIITRSKQIVNNYKVIKTIIEHDLSEEESLIYMGMKQTLSLLRTHMKTANVGKNEKKKFSTYILSMIIFLRQSIVTPILPIANIILEMSELKETRSDLSIILHNQFKKINLQEYLENEDSIKSTRLSKVLNTINSFNKTTDKTVVFSSFRTSLDILEYLIKKEIPKIEIFVLESSMSTARRGQLVDDFSKINKNSVLLTTYELGAEGLNLQAANTVIILEFWWNCSKHEQSIARVDRFGQKSPEVNIFFYTSNTGIEKSLFTKHHDKAVCLNEIKTGPLKSVVKSITMNEILKLIDTHENVKFLKNY